MVPIFPAMPNGVAKIGNSVVYQFLYHLFLDVVIHGV